MADTAVKRPEPALATDHREAYAERLFYALQWEPNDRRSWDMLSDREKGLFRVIVNALIGPNQEIRQMAEIGVDLSPLPM